jgi:hypothetical protein
LGIPAAFIAVAWIAKETHEPASDAAMLRNFARHEATFNTLVEMASVDKALDRVDETWTMPVDTKNVGVSPERLGDFRRHRQGVCLPDNSAGEHGSAGLADTLRARNLPFPTGDKQEYPECVVPEG